MVASLGLYAVGAWIGEESLRRLIKRFERFKLIFVADLERASEVFDKHGGKAILLGHLFPGIGALISIPAGIKRMPIMGRFMFYTVDRKSTRLNSSHANISYAVFCLKKK